MESNDTKRAPLRETHLDQIERWARFVRENPTTWKKQHTAFIDAIFRKHQEVVERLQASPEGKEKLRKLYPRF